MVTIILAEPEHPGNIGSVCRAMKNFGYKDLVLIEPRCDPHSQEAKNLAKHAQDVLLGARIETWDVLKEYALVAATAGVPTTDYNLRRSPLTPEEGAQKVLAVKKSSSHKGAALLFGRESSGLTNKELDKADFVITIPTRRKAASMNLSHAVAVMLYALTVAKPFERFTPIPANEKSILLKQFGEAIDGMHFPTDAMRMTQKRLWKNILGRALLTRREAFALFGFLRALGPQRTPPPTRAKQKQPRRTRTKQ